MGLHTILLIAKSVFGDRLKVKEIDPVTLEIYISRVGGVRIYEDKITKEIKIKNIDVSEGVLGALNSLFLK